MDSDDNDDNDVCLVTMTLLLIKKKLDIKKRARKHRTLWTQPWISRRLRMGAYHALIHELRSTDVRGYTSFLRMDPESFDLLLQKLGPIIAKEDTKLRLSIPAEERLAVTLRYLATGK
jgi:hypothetical protein